MPLIPGRACRGLLAAALLSAGLLPPLAAEDAPVPEATPATTTAAAAAANAADDQKKADLQAIDAYLAKTYPQIKNPNPRPVDSESLQKAYPGYRFYLIQMTRRSGGRRPPEPPPPAIDIALSFDAKGHLDPRSGAQAMNLGLMTVSTDAEAQVAAAAIMALLVCQGGASRVDLDKVTVSMQEKIRICTARIGWLAYEVQFDEKGVCIKAQIRDMMPPKP